MTSVGIHEAKTNLSKLLRRVSVGEEIIITRSGEPIAKIVPIKPDQKRWFGIDADRYEVPDDFNEPLPEELIAAFES
ncbi:MAG: type II toxin-antitoxin system Phd/YefM family antitoxin [Actinomycetota bacterium]|nr:type II toxin-antitoxin system Phd/YefM family antitoxin [Actinomycetota bacterium]MDK1016914.1 type II toxin-antitoxin system Phd/YefM family antitoxin [Actinomycetota bacterium]MDK1026925.1 type II toxin-antitoxin system Phd/YefM family antitoxin [Actinomycetota bacterium]MDK1037501.1 type II toxin-antitoxin system Phd/YefM family antitoxin [Actinomycetota bacterium]MDK1095934.1 type II toxin-antitoxin system Phd/YefM family antitoxin [Actinomycetota bacterium]